MSRPTPRLQPNGFTSTASRPGRTSTPLRARQPETSTQRDRGSCYQCGSFSHLYAQCPQHVVGLLHRWNAHDDNLKEKVYESTEEMILEAEALKANEAKERTVKGFIGLIHPMFTL